MSFPTPAETASPLAPILFVVADIAIASQSEEDNFEYGDTDTRVPTVSPVEAPTREEERDSYEFVAFLLWYMFLVICCVVPTCCAYRRRRMVEARMVQQRATFDRLGEQNLFVIGNILQMNMNELKQERTRRFTQELQSTSFTVKLSDIVENENAKEEVSSREQKNNGKSAFSAAEGANEEVGVGSEEGNIENTMLTLPIDATKASSRPRVVPGACAICLCQYEEGDVVTWSSKESCMHVFHLECIVPWLVKKSEPKCPCCRQDFCTVETTQSSQHHILTPFGLMPTAMAFPVRGQSFFSFPFRRALESTAGDSPNELDRGRETPTVPAEGETTIVSGNANANVEMTSLSPVESGVPRASDDDLEEGVNRGEDSPEDEYATRRQEGRDTDE